MILLRPSNERGLARSDWLESRHTFSFGRYYDPAWMGFGPLRVINQDQVAPGRGFERHGHANMEILSFVLSGRLEHRDSSGGGGVLGAGEVQLMSAGHGIEHSEFNASQDDPVHFLQVWIQPDQVNAQPRYAQARFRPDAGTGSLQLLASPDGEEGSLPIRQDARVSRGRLGRGERVEHPLAPGRRAWVQVLSGSVDLDSQALAAGDGAGVTAAACLSLAGTGPDVAEVLVFDLP